MWLFTSKPAADRKLAIPYTGPWKVIQQLSGTLRTIRPEGSWCTQPKTITVSLNRLKRCHGEERAVQRVDFDLHQLEDADDDAEGPMRNAWITADGSAATRALNQEVGDVHAPSLRERRSPGVTGEPALIQRSTVHPRDSEGVAPSLVVHHEHTNVVSPDLSSSVHRSFSRADSATMTAPETSTALIRPGPAPLSQTYFDRSAAVRLHSSQAGDERTLPPVSEVSQEEAPTPSPPPSNLSSSVPTADSVSLPRANLSSTAAPTDSSSIRPPNLSPTLTTTDSSSTTSPISSADMVTVDYGPEEPRGVKRAPSAGSVYSQLRRTYPAGPTNYPKRPGRPYFDFATSSGEESPPPPPRRPGRSRSPDSDYSREHRADSRDRHRYPKRHLRNRLAAILGRGPTLAVLTLFTLITLLFRCPPALAERGMLRNSHGLVEERYHLTAYDCSDPSDVQAYSSIPARPCSVRTTPVHRSKPSKFQLLQREKKRYVNGYFCSLVRTDIRYNCGVYGHSELDPLHWSFAIPQQVTMEECRTWLRTRTYRPKEHSTLMHGPTFERPLFLDEPNYIKYLVAGRTYTKGPSLPTDLVSEIACQGNWFEYEKDQPLSHMVAYYDVIRVHTVPLVMEDGVVIDQTHQLTLPCPWENGQCHAEGRAYLWNVTQPDYCPVAVVREFQGHRLYANLSDPDTTHGQRLGEAVVSSGTEEKIRIRPIGSSSQCGRVVTTTNVEDMYLFPLTEADSQGDLITDNRDQAFSRPIHPSEVDLRKYIANRDEYLYFDITSQAEKEFDAILHQDCLRRQEEARKAHFFEHGLPGYQPFLLRDGVFSTRSGETNYRYECIPRVVHPVSASRCYNKLPVVLRLAQHLSATTVLNFSASVTYFLDPDSRLLSPIASEVPCSAMFPAVYRAHQGWIAVTPEIHQAPSPEPLPVSSPRRTEDVFGQRDYNEGGLYQPATLDAMQDFLLTPLLREAVVYKLAHQIHNLRPENEHALGPLDLFPDTIAATADWRDLLFGGWWSWLEKWGKFVSICIGVYYLYLLGRWLLTTVFSLRVLYQEHGFGPNLLWGLGPGRNVFPMRFYRRWRRSKQTRPEHSSRTPERRSARPPHDYLALDEVEVPPLPRRNRAVDNIYPPLPAKPASLYSNDPRGEYAVPNNRPTTIKRADVLAADTRHLTTTLGDRSKLVPTNLDQPSTRTPPAADTRVTSHVASPAAPGVEGLPTSSAPANQSPADDLFPKGPIGDVMRGGPRL